MRLVVTVGAEVAEAERVGWLLLVVTPDVVEAERVGWLLLVDVLLVDVVKELEVV